MKRSAWFRALAPAAAAALLVMTAAPALAPAQTVPRLNGDQLLKRATIAPRLMSYAVPVAFDVHLHKPLGLHSQVEGTAYFRAPAQAALQITHASGIVGGFFKGAYNLDMVPQAWPYHYHVVAVTPGVADGAPVLLLRAQPRGGSSSITQVVFTLSRPGLQPLAAEWDYQDASTIHLTYVNQHIGSYTLPQQATISVDMPHYKLDADATYGDYSLNAPVTDDVFTDAK